MASLPDGARRRLAERRGRRAEGVAALWLRLKGYRVLDRRVRTPVGEIDLVLRRGGTLVFAEVKRRVALADGMAAVGPAQRRRIGRAAEW
ncbi:MAG: YraN family protein, partial [Azospirillaceae bacterium]